MSYRIHIGIVKRIDLENHLSKELRDKLFAVPKRYKYCLEDRITNIRKHPTEEEHIANTLDGNEVYVKLLDYDVEGTRAGVTFYKLRNRM